MGHKMWVPLSKRELRFPCGENRVTRLFSVERRPAVSGETSGTEERTRRLSGVSVHQAADEMGFRLENSPGFWLYPVTSQTCKSTLVGTPIRDAPPLPLPRVPEE